MDAAEASGRLRFEVRPEYALCVARAGGLPVHLPPLVEVVEAHAALCDAIVFTGGGDPAMEPFGRTTHHAASLVHPSRQSYETALYAALDRRPGIPVLGVCLGMQLMTLRAGGDMDQHLPETLATADRHQGGTLHPVSPTDARGPVALGAGRVASFHHQAMRDAGSLAVLARSDDGVIEAVADPTRPFYMGVQWHPERTPDHGLGQRLFDELVAAARHARR